MEREVGVKSLRKFADERGFLAEAMREDMKDILGGDKIVRQIIPSPTLGQWGLAQAQQRTE